MVVVDEAAEEEADGDDWFEELFGIFMMFDLAGESDVSAPLTAGCNGGATAAAADDVDDAWGGAAGISLLPSFAIDDCGGGTYSEYWLDVFEISKI